ncbi:MAG: hypothetical protein AB7T63_15600 [Planctomycetota bacterium]
MTSESLASRRAAIQLAAQSTGVVSYTLTGQPGWGGEVASLRLVQRSTGTPVVQVDASSGLAPLPNVRPVRSGGDVTVSASVIQQVGAAPDAFDVVLRNASGAEIVRGPLSSSFTFDLGGVLQHPLEMAGGAPSGFAIDGESYLALRAQSPSALHAWMTTRDGVSPSWVAPLRLLPPAAVSPSPLLEWTSLLADLDSVTGVATSPLAQVDANLLLWLWVEPSALGVSLQATGGAGSYVGTVGPPDLAVWGRLEATSTGGPAGLVLEAETWSEAHVAFSLAREAFDPSPTQVRVLKDGGPAPLAVLNLAAMAPDDGNGNLEGSVALDPEVALALLTGRSSISCVLDTTADVGTHAGSLGHPTYRFFAFEETPFGSGSLTDPATGASEIVLTAEGLLEHATYLVGPPAGNVGGVEIRRLGDADGLLTLATSPVSGKEALGGTSSDLTPMFLAEVISVHPTLQVAVMVGENVGPAGKLVATFACTDDPYIPPFEGIWLDEDDEQWVLNSTASLPVSCGLVSGGTTELSFVGSYEGKALMGILAGPSGDTPVEGQIVGNTSRPGDVAIEFDATDGSGLHIVCTHDGYRWPARGVWRTQAGDWIAVVEGGFVHGEEFQGVVRGGGVEYPLQGERSSDPGNGSGTATWTGAAPPWSSTQPGLLFSFEAAHESMLIDGKLFFRMTPEE